MKITFVLRETGISGGVKAIFEFANHLVERGHKVSLICPFVPLISGVKLYDFKKIIKGALYTIRNLKKKNSLDWFDLKTNIIKVPWLWERWIPDADIIVATWWETAYYVNRYSRTKGEKFYLAQHYETWAGPEEKVKNSYKLGLKIIVNSTWLKNILENELGVKTKALIFHAPDWEQFYSKERKNKNKTIKILIPQRREDWKGSEDGVKAFEIVKEKFPNIHLVMFGLESNKLFSLCDEYYKRPFKSKLREIYKSCDIFVFPSRCEGFGMPSMEAMVCKRPVVTTNVGAVPDYAIAGKTALVSLPRNPEALAQNIIKLLEDENKRKQIAENGHNYIKQFTWAKATAQLEKVFENELS